MHITQIEYITPSRSALQMVPYLYGNPICMSGAGDALALETHRLVLETELNRLTEEAQRAVLA